jgi:hypothetical protein
VLWYGNEEKVAELCDPTIRTAAELKDRIVSRMSEDLRTPIDAALADTNAQAV